MYARQIQTVFGKVFNTPVIDGAGSFAVFGPPWAPDEGVLNVPVQASVPVIAVRVMDYDLGRKDDLLGEVSIEINRDALGREMETFDLYRKGKRGKGQVQLSLAWNEDGNGVRIRVHQASDCARLI